jgi:hypothetical protein
MLSIDLKNAIESPELNNFSCLLFRLILKADSRNKDKLFCSYPVEVEMVSIYQNECPYSRPETGIGIVLGEGEPDWDAIEKKARERTEESK